jgi:GTP-binding protein
LIEGASKGVGLGHAFLAHLERARLLLHVIDCSEGDADERWHAIDGELAAYGAGLDERPQVAVLNKIDLEPNPSFSVDDPRILRVFRVSCATGAGVEELKRSLFELCPPAEPAALAKNGLVDFLVYRPRPTARRYRILRTDRGFRITGEPPTDGAELEAALKAAGARKGDEVEVEGEVREWA